MAVKEIVKSLPITLLDIHEKLKVVKCNFNDSSLIYRGIAIYQPNPVVGLMQNGVVNRHIMNDSRYVMRSIKAFIT